MEIVYLLQPAELVGGDIYKLGYSLSKDIARCKNGYKKGTRYICIIKCDNSKLLENILKEEFKKKFKLVVGNEYFKGEESDLQKEFLKIVFKHLQLEIKEELPKDIEINIYEKFLKERTEKSNFHISNVVLYDAFCVWFKENYKDEPIPSNRHFIKQIKKLVPVLHLCTFKTPIFLNMQIINNFLMFFFC